MEIIVCAMNCELKPLRDYFRSSIKFYNCGLKAKNLDFLNNVGKNDHITNIGICGGLQIGKIYLANEIIGDKIYYPDNLISTKIPQRKIKTVNYLADNDEISRNPNVLYEQEAAIIYGAASKYIGPHQMSFLKVVSDNGANTIKLDENYISNIIENQISEIEEFIISSKKIFTQLKDNKIENLDQYSKFLKCSVSMKNKLATQLRYAQICNININEFFNNTKAPKTKQESLKALNELDKFLLQ